MHMALQAVQAMRKEDLRRRSHAAEVGHVPMQAHWGGFGAGKLATWVGPEMPHYPKIAVSMEWKPLLSNYGAHFWENMGMLHVGSWP